ncbi:MAG: transglutaminase domain-containing protein [Candidatus Saccharibacteria bacterium]
MRRQRRISSIILIIALTATMLGLNTATAMADYSIGFTNSDIQITSPSTSGSTYNGTLEVSGTSRLQKVWFAVRGPQGELITYPANVRDGQFKLNMYLRFGAGKYTIWAGNNNTQFDGTIRFEINNANQDMTRYTTPSAYVDSDNPAIVALVQSIIKPGMTDAEKLKTIHDWVAKNISYDYQQYLNGENRIVPASQTLKERTGVCRHYAFLVAAMCRAAGLPAKVVYGEAVSDGSWETQSHAWNEVYVSGNWVSVDATWDAGYIKGTKFVFSYSNKYLNPNTTTFASTHKNAVYTVH